MDINNIQEKIAENIQKQNDAVAKKDKADFLKILHESLKTAVFYIFLFSAVINILTIILPLYSLQVFDRVLSSGSISTLTALSALALFSFILFSIFSSVREYILIKVGSWLDEKLNERAFRLSVNHSSISGQRMGSQFINEAAQVKNFLTSQAIFSIFDLPWTLVFMFIIYMISPQICLLVIFGTIVLFGLTYYKEFKTKPQIKETQDIASANMKRGDEVIRSSEVVESMGMFSNLYNIWKEEHDIVKDRSKNTAFLASRLSSISKALRMTLQIAIIGYGTYLALKSEMTFGGIIACSILAGKAMAPMDAIMSIWSSFGNFRDSYGKLRGFLISAAERNEVTNLGRPEGNITFEKVVFMKPGSLQAIIKGMELEIKAGETIGIIGPSGSGKSTALKLMAGIYKASMGAVKLDEGDIFKRNREDVGKFIGYLPQSIDLIKGTIKENISRFAKEVNDEDVINAAKITGVHELILGLPDGYDTVIGEGGAELSGGQKQRVGLARAFYGDPQLVFLDEPNANLDEVGERMLLQAIIHAKQKKRTLVMISHKPSIVNIVDKIIVIRDGTVMDYGTKDEIMSKYAGNQSRAQQQAVQQAVNEKMAQEAKEKAEKQIGQIVEELN